MYMNLHRRTELIPLSLFNSRDRRFLSSSVVQEAAGERFFFFLHSDSFIELQHLLQQKIIINY